MHPYSYRRDVTDEPNVLLVVADSLRARNASVLGYRRKTTPFLESFSDRATVYTQARSPSNWTLPSHVSLFTGEPVAAHGFDLSDRLEPGHTIFEALADRGYATGLFSDNPFLTDHESALERAFEHARGTPSSFPDRYETNGSLGDWPNGFWYADRFLDWSDDRSDPWAACVNLMDTHRPYEPLETYDRWSDETVREIQETMGFKWHWEFLSGSTSLGFAKLLESIYDGAVRQADAVVARLVDGLEARGELEDTLVVVTSDHGEAFGAGTALEAEPPAVSHRIGTHEYLYHVPLVVKAPGQTEGAVIDDLATLTAFPDAVRAAVDGSGGGRSDEAFVASDGRAVATQFPIAEGMRSEAERICGSAEPYAKRADVVYEDRPGESVLKRARWGNDAYETLVVGRDERRDRGIVPASTVAEAVDDLAGDPATVGRPLDEYGEFADGYENEFADELEERLEALGYR